MYARFKNNILYIFSIYSDFDFSFTNSRHAWAKYKICNYIGGACSACKNLNGRIALPYPKKRVAL